MGHNKESIDLMIRVRKNRTVTRIILLTITSFFIFHYGGRGKFSWVNTISSTILYPFLRLQHIIAAPIAALKEKHVAIQDLKSQVFLLNKEKEALIAENISLRGSLYHGMQIKDLVEFNKRYQEKGVIAQVLARHFSSENHFFLIDAGMSIGIKKDMIALYCNTIIGKVVEVYPWYCKVSLVTDNDCKIAAVCLPSEINPKKSVKGVKGIHEGTNSFQTTLRYVSHLDLVKVGDQVFSSGEGLIFPQGFALGTIVAAKKEDLFYTISVEPQVDLQKLEYCILIARDDI